MPQYKTISNQSVFDVCISTTGDFTSLNGIISQFRNINNFVPIGETVEYTITPVVKPLIYYVPVDNAKSTTYSTVDYQSVYDVAVQLKGDISRVDDILKIVRNLGQKISIAFPIQYTPNTDPVSEFFTGKTVATAFYDTAIVEEYRLLENGDFRITESAEFRILE